MIDLSDGLLQDLGHLLAASGVGARVEREALPLSAPFRAALAGEPGCIDLALGGGEDYELLLTVPPEREAALAEVAARTGVPLARVGEITAPAGGLTVLDGEGRDCTPRRGGFNHFAAVG